MATSFQTASLQTTVRNTSGVTRHFSFLGAHGVTLGDGNDYTFDGDLYTAVGLSAYGRFNRRRQAAFKRAIGEGLLTIIKTPAAVYADLDGQPKHLLVDNGVVSGVSPDWETSESV